MDLTAAITGMQRASLAARIQVRVAQKILANQQFQGSAAVKLIEAADNETAQAGDALTAAATGLGGLVDTYG